MSCKNIDLCPNRNLLNPNFDGYKLSLEPTPILKENLLTRPAILSQSDEQFSCLHAELFGLNNFLIKDKFNKNTTYNCAYFVDELWNVNKIVYNCKTGQLQGILKVFRIPKERTVISGDYNVTFVFISDNQCLLSDGIGNLFFIETGNRELDENWNIIHQEKPLSSISNFIIKYARYDYFEDNTELNIILYHIIQESGSFYSVLEWVSYKTPSPQQFEFFTRRQLKGKGSIKYIAIEESNSGLILSTDTKFKFVLDTEYPIIEESNEPINNKNIEAQNYSWHQTSKEIFIEFKYFPDSEISDYQIECLDSKVKVAFKDRNLIDAEFFEDIKSELALQSFENGKLKINLTKVNEGMNWPYLVIDGYDESPPGIIVEKESEANNSIKTTLDEQFEECDFTFHGEQTEFFIVKFNRKSHEITHKINLGNIPPLFVIELNSNSLPSFALRYDVDAIIWTPKVKSSGDEDWNFMHEGTLNAFGYVQASKEQKKFMFCSPDFSYSVICESKRHLFLYKSNYETAGGLRNRTGANKSIGQQKLITLENTGEVIGMQVYNEITILLTENHILCIQAKV